MASDIGAMKRDIERRLRDLPQLIEEHDRLIAAHAVLTRDGGRRVDAGVPSRRRAPHGANRDAIIAAVRELPGITSAQLAVETGIARTTVYATVASLKRGGAIAPHEGGYRIAVA